MQNRWFSDGCVSGLQLLSSTAGGNLIQPSPLFPDPLDPSLSFSLSHFPLLFPTVFSLTRKPSLHTALSKEPAGLSLAEVSSSLTTDVVMKEHVSSSPILTSDLKINLALEHTVPANFTVVQPKASSPFFTNLASSPPTLPTSNQNPTIPTADEIGSSQQNPQNTIPRKSNFATVPQNLAEKLRFTSDKTLKKLAPVTMAAPGRPHVVIPDEVFQRGAELHRDFIVCYFCGKAPPYKQFKSVLNHMWGKGRKLEIHIYQFMNSMLVRIHNDYIR